MITGMKIKNDKLKEIKIEKKSMTHGKFAYGCC